MGVVDHLYVSTYCQHAQHEDCRNTCKICYQPCLCPCHPTIRPRHDTEDHEAWLRRDQGAYPTTSGGTDAVAGA